MLKCNSKRREKWLRNLKNGAMVAATSVIAIVSMLFLHSCEEEAPCLYGPGPITDSTFNEPDSVSIQESPIDTSEDDR